jgi:hypothetical protein
MRGKKLDVVPLLRGSNNDVRPRAGLLSELSAAAAGEGPHPQARHDLLRQAAVLVKPGRGYTGKFRLGRGMDAYLVREGRRVWRG